MTPLSTSWLVGLLALHVTALAIAWATRVAAGSKVEGFLQLLFFVAMVGVGLSAWYGHGHNLGLGIPSGLTLTTMVLLAITDFRRTHEPAHFSPLPLHG